MRIDVHTHFMSEQVARTLEKRSHFPYARFVDGTYHFHCCQGLTVPMSPPLRDMQRKLADMDSAGIDVAVLSLGIPGPELLGGAEADEVARLVNDALAEIIAQHPDPYGPWRRPIQFLDELGCTESEREQMRHGNAQRLFLP